MSDSSISPGKRASRYLRRLFRWRRPEASQLLFEELLYLSERTQSLEAFFTIMPERICTALRLSSFHIFLRENNSFVLQSPAAAEVAGAPPVLAGNLSFPFTSSLAVRMRRDRKPALFIPPSRAGVEPDGWQLLATTAEVDALAELGAQVLLPLEGQTRLQGFVALGRPTGQSFTAGELQFLADLGSRMGHGLETALLIRSLSEEAIHRANARRELEFAREVQERLLPPTLTVPPGYQAAAAYRSAGQIGGDYYDLFALPSGLLCMVIADVSGKGVPAALLMAGLRASLQALMLQPGAPEAAVPLAGIVAKLNSLLYRSSSISRYATLFCALLDPETGRLTSINAGHNAPFLLRNGQAPTRLAVGGTVVGLLPDCIYEEEVQTLEPGETLVLFTDGVSEAMNARSEEWGERNFLRSLEEGCCLPNSSAQTLVDTVLSGLGKHTANTPQNDDITLLVVRRVPLREPEN